MGIVKKNSILLVEFTNQVRDEAESPADRERVGERLAPDGWEPCGTWFFYAYYKRPKAALVGPAAELDAPPPRPAGRVFFSGRFYLFVAVYLLVLVPLVIGLRYVFPGSSLGWDLETVVGMIVGLAAGLAGTTVVILVAERRHRRRQGR